MKLPKIIEIELSFNDPINAYTSDVNQTSLALFNNKWAGRCYYGAYIIEATEVKNSGLITISNRNTNRKCSISLQLLCKTIQYERMEVIVITISNIDNSGTIFGKSNYAIVNIKNDNRSLAGVSKGDKIPVFVSNKEYIPNKKLITVSAIPFLPYYADEYYEVTEEDEFEMPTLDSDLEELENAEKANPKIAAEFRKLLITQSKKSKHKPIEIKNANKIKSGDIVLLPREFKYTGYFSILDSKSAIHSSGIAISAVKCSKKMVVNILFAKYRLDINNLKTLIEEISVEEFAKNKLLWNTYRTFNEEISAKSK